MLHVSSGMHVFWSVRVDNVMRGIGSQMKKRGAHAPRRRQKVFRSVLTLVLEFT